MEIIGPCDSNDDNSKENQSQIAMSPSSILATSALASPSSASSPSISNPADSQPSPSISQQDSGTVATSDSPESNPPESTDQNGDKNSSTAEPDKTELAEQGKNWSTRPTHTRPAGSDHCFHTWCPSVSTFLNQAKQNKYSLPGVLWDGLGDHWRLSIVLYYITNWFFITIHRTLWFCGKRN